MEIEQTTSIRDTNYKLSPQIEWQLTKMTTPVASNTFAAEKPHVETNTIVESKSNSITTSETRTSTNKQVWTRLNHKGIYHDNRRLLKHRARNCECFVCYREIYKLPPAETHEEYVESLKQKMNEREIKRIMRLANKEVKAGKQIRIDQCFRKEK